MKLVNIIVWVDATQAFIFLFNHDESRQKSLQAKHQNRAILGAHGLKAHDAREFFEEIESTIRSGNEILIAGPDETKFELEEYLKAKKSFRHRILGVQVSNHANDEDIHHLSRQFFTPPANLVHSSYVAGV